MKYSEAGAKRPQLFDLALTNFGWCSTPFATLDSPLRWEHGVERVEDINGHPRLERLLQLLRARVTNDFLVERPLVVMEDLSFAHNQSYAKENAGLAFMFRHWLWNTGYDFLLVAPTQIKKFATGSGAASVKKEVVIKEVLKRFQVDVNDDNEADAIVLCYVGAAFLNEWEPQIQPQWDVLAELYKKFPLTFSNAT